ncbi:MAG: lactate utilization protein [Acetobacteraceae bacterium]|nr:lactate utilization protein [Acetobacteraceae bacterium]
MSRDAILGAIRRGLRRGRLPEDQKLGLRARLDAHPRHLIPARSLVPRPAQVSLFIANVEKEFGSVARVPTLADVPAAIANYLAAGNLPAHFAMAPHPDLTGLDWALLQPRVGRAQPSDLVCLTQAFAGIAETGTLMLPGEFMRPTTLNLLGDIALVVLRASRIVGPYEDAWNWLRARHDSTTGGFMPRNVMLVTGPSRSADIESTLELGAHGPRQLHIVLVDDDPAAIA